MAASMPLKSVADFLLKNGNIFIRGYQTRVSVVGGNQYTNELKFKPSDSSKLKEIVRRKNADDSLTIEAVPVKNVPKTVVLDLDSGACPLCSLNMEIHYTDVLILRQFLRSDGRLLPRRVTGLCAKQQMNMARLVHKAQNAGLLTSLRPPLPDGKLRKPDKDSTYKFKGLERYFTENYK